MAANHIKDEDTEDTSVDTVRRRLLKIGIYSVPTIILLGRASVARASNGITPLTPLTPLTPPSPPSPPSP